MDFLKKNRNSNSASQVCRINKIELYYLNEDMKDFKIDVNDICWLDGKIKNKWDLCAHGHVTVKIGSYSDEYFGGSVSATALYLLKTLTRDHISGTEIQIVPCCGFGMCSEEPDEFGEICKIIGCPDGLDWTVKHDGNFIRLISKNDITVSVPFAQYKTEVFAFSDKVKQFYDSGLPRNISDCDKHDIAGFKAFCDEWKMHYEKWGYRFGNDIRIYRSKIKMFTNDIIKKIT